MKLPKLGTPENHTPTLKVLSLPHMQVASGPSCSALDEERLCKTVHVEGTEPGADETRTWGLPESFPTALPAQRA